MKIGYADPPYIGPGSGAVSRAWKTWQGKFTLPPFELDAAE